jgi:hypothetical protein
MDEKIPDNIDDVIEKTKARDPEFQFWLPVDVNMYEHRKTRRLAEHLGIPRPYALGLVITFLSKVFKFATTGNITGDNVSEIQFWSEYPGDRNFTDCMLKSGFLDTIEGGFRVHKWDHRMKRFLNKLGHDHKKRVKATDRQQRRRKGMAYERANRPYGAETSYLRKPPIRPPENGGEIRPGNGPENTPVFSHVAPLSHENGATRPKNVNGESLSDIPLSRTCSVTERDRVLHDFEGVKTPPSGAKSESPIVYKLTEIPLSRPCSACSGDNTAYNRETKTKAGRDENRVRPLSSFSPTKIKTKTETKTDRETDIEKLVDLWSMLYQDRVGPVRNTDHVREVLASLLGLGRTLPQLELRIRNWFKTDIPWTRRVRYRVDRFVSKWNELGSGPLPKYEEAGKRRADGGFDKPKGDERTVDDFD